MIQEFAFEFEDKTQKTQILKLGSKADQATAKDTPINIKQGSKYRFKVQFSVNGEIVALLKFINTVKTSLSNQTSELVLGSYGPGATHTFTFPRHGWNEAPSGMMYRGKYKCQMQFVDGDGKCHLDVPYALNITK